MICYKIIGQKFSIKLFIADRILFPSSRLVTIRPSRVSTKNESTEGSREESQPTGPGSEERYANNEHRRVLV